MLSKINKTIFIERGSNQSKPQPNLGIKNHTHARETAIVPRASHKKVDR